jgi:erythrin-vacuolar iron transport family protein
MSKTIDYAKLTLKDALDLAILIEDEAKERYEEFAAQMETHHTTDAAKFYRFMAQNEAKHGRDLLERRQTLFGAAPSRIDRSMLWEVEAPEYEKAHAFMSPRAALEVALESEAKAWLFFDGVLKHTHEPEVRHLFEELRGEEEEHKALVRAEIAKLPPDSGLADEDFADEPVAQ